MRSRVVNAILGSGRRAREFSLGSGGAVVRVSSTIGALSLLGTLAGAAVAGCIPDPKGDFDDYTDRTAPFRDVSREGGTGIGDAAPPTAAEEGLYYGVCLSTLAASNPRNVLRFYTETKFTPEGAGGKLNIKLTAMKVGPNRTPPATVSRGETAGDTVSVDTTTNEKGVYAANFGTVRLPGETNPLTGRPIVVENTALPGRFSKDKFCSQLIGHVVEPTDIQLEGDKNTCIYIQVKDGDPAPPVELADFPSSCSLD